MAQRLKTAAKRLVNADALGTKGIGMVESTGALIFSEHTRWMTASSSALKELIKASMMGIGREYGRVHATMD
jgi:hypothetical protein